MKKAPRTDAARTSLRGRSGRTYHFEVYALPGRFRDVEAVYVFAKLAPNPAGGILHVPLSIGHTAELGKEIENHGSSSRLEAQGCNAICILPVAGEEKRRAIEADLRAAHATPCDDEGQ